MVSKFSVVFPCGLSYAWEKDEVTKVDFKSSLVCPLHEKECGPYVAQQYAPGGSLPPEANIE